MTLAVVFPDVVEITTGYLTDALGFTVHHREPNPFPTTTSNDTPTVTVRRFGGRAEIVTALPRIDVQVWHSTSADAADLADLVVAHMLAMPASTPNVYRVGVFSLPAEIWDTDRNLPRYLCSFEPRVRGTAL